MENREEYINHLIAKKSEPQTRVLFGVPMTGLIRSEWMMARLGQVIPCNWGMVDMMQYLDQWSPLRFTVADARNIIVDFVVEKDFEWLFFIDHDVIMPPGTIVKINDRMRESKIPILSGLYFTKSIPSEPLVYRGRGNSFYDKWKLGEEVWVDSLPMGCTLIHGSILKALAKESESYDPGINKNIKRIFETPAKVWYDPEKGGWRTETGTEDLNFCYRIIFDRIFDKAGWPEYQEKEWPFLIDTSIFCRHIDWNGVQYPARGEEKEFIPDDVLEELDIK